MSEDLTAKICAPCRGGIPPLPREGAEKLLTQAAGWTLEGDAHHIFRRFKFGNFADSLAFVNMVGALAEQEGHHPDITFGWGYVEITIFSHEIDGLHENDFILAAKINQL